MTLPNWICKRVVPVYPLVFVPILICSIPRIFLNVSSWSTSFDVRSMWRPSGERHPSEARSPTAYASSGCHVVSMVAFGFGPRFPIHIVYVRSPLHTSVLSAVETHPTLHKKNDLSAVSFVFVIKLFSLFFLFFCIRFFSSLARRLVRR